LLLLFLILGPHTENVAPIRLRLTSDEVAQQLANCWTSYLYENADSLVTVRFLNKEKNFLIKTNKDKYLLKIISLMKEFIKDNSKENVLYKINDQFILYWKEP
jgi:hypothetical protein